MDCSRKYPNDQRTTTSIVKTDWVTAKYAFKGKPKRKYEDDENYGQLMEIDITLEQATDILKMIRARAAGWQAGSASLVALILASLVFSSDKAWITGFSGSNLIVLAVLIAVALSFAMVSMWLVLRAAHGPFTLDARIRDYHQPHNGPRIFNRAKTAALELQWGQACLLAGVLFLVISMFLTWFMV